MSMLDDFVEHAAGPSAPRYTSRAPAQTRGGFDNVEYEGFEQDEGQDDAAQSSQVLSLETGFIPSSRGTGNLPPLFSLSLVQYTPPAPILHLTAANNMLFLAIAPLSVILIDLAKPDELVTVDLPRPAADKGQAAARDVPVIRRLFVDPAARHLIITTSSSDAFYLPVSPGNPAVQSRRPRPLRIRQTITAVGWSPISGAAPDGTATEGASKGDAVTPPSTDVLLGCASGAILSLPLPPQDDIFKSVNLSMGKPLERDLQTVYTLPDGQAVTGVTFGFWNALKKRDKRAWVVFTTKDRMYEVQGTVSTTTAGGKGGGWAEEMFRPVREGAPKFQELPGDPPSSELRVYLPVGDGQSTTSLPAPNSLAWLTGPGLYHAGIASSPSTETLEKASLLPYPAAAPETPAPAFNRAPAASDGPQIPISVVITRWHWLFLYADHVVAVASETEKVVWDEALPMAPDETALGLSSDPLSRTFWIYTDHSILEIVVNKEDRDVWRAKLEKGSYEDALRFASTPAQKDVVLSRQGDALFAEAKYMLAAQCYAKSSRSFEYVTLRFIDADERDALRLYLAGRLERLDRADKTQRMMLATWLVEIYLSKCNTLEDVIAAEAATSDVDNLMAEKEIMEEELQTFLEESKNDLDPKIVYELVLSHGRTDLYLFYANLNKDHAKVVQHWIAEEQWRKAVDALNRQSSLDLYYDVASILMRHAPKETVDAWIRQPALSPRRLIPALQTQQAVPAASSQAVRYLSHVVFQQASTDPTIHNLLLAFYAADTDASDGPLLRFLSTAPDDPATERPYYDLDYALRQCLKHGRVGACVHVYAKMGLYESSVELALDRGDLPLAMANADRPEDDDALRRKLWLKIAKYVVQEKKDIKSAMTFLESTDLVKIEDILPFFPDFVVIDDFKAEICSALEDYSRKIDDLRAEMDEATASAAAIRRDIDALAGRFVMVEPGEKCWKCAAALVARQFYVFPCQHVFHADCLISMAMEFLPAPTLRRILHLQTELVGTDDARSALLSASFSPAPSGTGTPRREASASAAGGAADLLLGVPGRKLVAAGDRLRELIVPDALAQAVSAVGSVGLGGGLGGRKVGAAAGKTRRERARDDARAEAARNELDELVAGACPLCEGVVVGLDRPFVAPGEEGDWAI
ncbi:tethering complex subunit [Cryptotrichosporon argae]